jgi:hypothetical protein
MINEILYSLLLIDSIKKLLKSYGGCQGISFFFMNYTCCFVFLCFDMQSFRNTTPQAQVVLSFLFSRIASIFCMILASFFSILISLFFR